MRKITVVVTARASYARCLTMLRALHQRRDAELCVAMEVGLWNMLGKAKQESFFRRPLHSHVDGEKPWDAVTFTGELLEELAGWFADEKPDLVVTIGDRYETMATAIAASYEGIPLAHLQGGEVSGNIDDKVRNAVTQLADFHFVATERSEWRVMDRGADHTRVYRTGCPSIDLAKEAEQRLDLRPIEPGLMVLMHPETETWQIYPEQMECLREAIDGLAFSGPVTWFTPNPDPKSQWDGSHYPAVSQSPERFVASLNMAACLVGNSSAGVREASYFGTPVVNIGSRQKGRERAGNVVDVPHDSAAIIKAIRQQIGHGRYQPSQLYGDGHAGERITDLLATIPLERGRTGVNA